MAAIYGLYVAEKMGKRLELELTDWKFWSYSVHVLYWTHVLSPTFKPFVANRVGYIQMRTSPKEWRHVSALSNRANPLTPAFTVAALIDSDMW